MGDNIAIDWRNADPVPDFTNSFTTAFAAGHQMAMQRQADAARNAVLADPNDQNALTKLSMLDPQSAQAIYTNQDRARAMAARAAAGQVVSAYGMPGAAGPAPNAFAPQPAPQPVATSPAGAPPTAARMSGPPGGAAAPAGQPQQPAQPTAGQPVAQSPVMDASHPVAQQIGQAAVAGQVDPQHAWAALYAADPQMGDQMVKAVSGIDGIRLSRLAESNNALGAEAQTLLSVPQAQRAAELQRIAPQLLQHGVTPDQLRGAMQEGLSDNFLHGVVGQSIGTSGLLEEAHKNAADSIADRRATTDEKAQAETVRNDNLQANAGVVIQNALGGSTLVNRATGRQIYNSDGADSGGQMTGGWTPRARNGGDNADPVVDNKIAGAAKFLGVEPTADFGNLSNMQIAKAMALSEGGRGSLADRNNNPGNLTDPKTGQYRVFPNKQAGLEAAARQVGIDRARGQNSVQSLVEGLPKGGGGGSSLQDSMMARAKQIANYDSSISAREKAGPRGNALMAMVQQINPQYDETIYTQKSSAMRDFGTKSAGSVRSLNVAVQHLDTLQAAADALHNGKVPFFNSLSQSFAQATGSAIPSNFEAVKDMVMGEVTKATIGTAGGQGDREKAQGVMNRAQSPEQLAGAIYQVKQLMGGQLKGYAHQYESTTGRKDFSKYLDDHTAKVLGFDKGGGSGGGSATVIRYDAKGNRVK